MHLSSAVTNNAPRHLTTLSISTVLLPKVGLALTRAYPLSYSNMSEVHIVSCSALNMFVNLSVRQRAAFLDVCARTSHFSLSSLGGPLTTDGAWTTCLQHLPYSCYLECIHCDPFACSECAWHCSGSKARAQVTFVLTYTVLIALWRASTIADPANKNANIGLFGASAEMSNLTTHG